MKICIVVILFVVMAFQSANKAIILTSFYLNKEYIAQNECVNRFEKIPICKGQCYLETELKKTDEQNHKIPALKYKEIQLFYSENKLSENKYTYENGVVEKKCFYYKETIISPLQFTIFHPPQIS